MMTEVTSKNEDDISDVVSSEATSEERFLISDLCDLTSQYMDQEQVKEVYRAYLFGAQAHEGQVRASGEPYIYHPIAVARILAQPGPDRDAQVRAVFNFALGRDPAATALEDALEFLSASDPEGDERAALTDLCQVVISSNEFLYID